MNKQCDNPRCPNYHGNTTPDGKTKLIQKVLGPGVTPVDCNQYLLPNSLVVTYCSICEAAVDFLKQCAAQPAKKHDKH